MNSDELKELVRNNTDLLLDKLCVPAKKRVNGQQSYVCPFCEHGQGGDGIAIEPGKPWHIKCFGVDKTSGAKCFSGDIIDFYARLNHLDQETDFRRILSDLGGLLGYTLDQTPRTIAAIPAPKTAPPPPPPPQPPAWDELLQEVVGGVCEGHKRDEPVSDDEWAKMKALSQERAAYISKCASGLCSNTAALKYLQGRGFGENDSVLEDFCVGVDPHFVQSKMPGLYKEKGWTLNPKAFAPRIILPTIVGGGVLQGYDDVYVSYEARAISKAEEERHQRWLSEGPKLPFFNSKVYDFAHAKYIYVTEGSFDALAVAAGLRDYNVVALNGVGNVGLLLRMIAICRENVPEDSPLRIGDNTVFVLLIDTDGQGRAANKALQIGLAQMGLRSKDITKSVLTHGKDPAESFLYMATVDPANDNNTIAGSWAVITDSVKRAIADAALVDSAPVAERDEPSTVDAPPPMFPYVSGLYDKFRAQVNASRKPLSTGIKGLDEALGGGLYPGLYVIGAVTSLGKTTLALQICDHLAEQGTDAFIFSLEMPDTELMAKSISRISYQMALKQCAGTSVNDDTRREQVKRLALETNEVLYGCNEFSQDSKRLELYNAAEQAYFGRGGHLLIQEVSADADAGDITAGKIKEIITGYIDSTHRKPVVLVDYAQLVAPDNDRRTEKQNTDNSVKELKRLSRSQGITVILISSFNRENYVQAVNLTSFKESGGIEYGSDVLMGLQFELMKHVDNPKRTLLRGIDKTRMDEQVRRKKNGDEMWMTVEVLKNRSGRPGTAYVNYCSRFNCFTSGHKHIEYEYNALSPDLGEPNVKQSRWGADALASSVGMRQQQEPPEENQIDIPF